MDLSELLPTILGSTVLMFTCWFLGRFNYSTLWVVIFIAFNVLKSKLWKEKQRRVIALQQAATREKEVVLAQLRDLPAWVQFPDTERVEWMNKVIFQLWPYIGEYTRHFIKDIVEPQIKSHLPNMFKSFRFQEIDIGDIPLRVSGIKVYSENVGRDRIVMDMDVAYAGDCEFVVAIGALKGGLRQVQFKGKLRAILTPLIPKPPLIGGVSAFFLDAPTVDFDLTGLGEFVELPLLITTVRNVINEQISSICVLPNQIVVPLTTETDVVQMYFQEPDGVVRIRCIEGRNLENRDILLQGKSDPFARFSVGAQTFQTKTIDNTLNPVWNETFEAIVDQGSGQKVMVEVFDDDVGKNDDFLGRTKVEVAIVAEKGKLDEWYQLEGVKHGDLHLSLSWMHLTQSQSTSFSSYELNEKMLSTALLMIYVDNVSNLPSSKLDFEPSPFVELSLGKNTQKTFPKPKTRSPLYRQKFIFFVNNVELQTLKIEAKDDANSAKPLGECTLPLKNLLQEPNLEMFQRTMYLIMGPHSSPAVLSFRLRFLQSALTEPKIPQKTDKSLNTIQNFVSEGALFKSNNAPVNNRKASADFRGSVGRIPHYVDSSTTGTLRLRKLKRHRASVLASEALGSLELSLLYDELSKKLTIDVIRAQDLKPFSKDSPISPYVSVKLLINGVVTVKHKTATFVKTSEPHFGESLTFELTPNDYAFATLILDVKDSSHSSWIKETPVTGQVLFDLAKLKPGILIKSWFDLHEPCYLRDQSCSKSDNFK